MREVVIRRTNGGFDVAAAIADGSAQDRGEGQQERWRGE